MQSARKLRLSGLHTRHGLKFLRRLNVVDPTSTERDAGDEVTREECTQRKIVDLSQADIGSGSALVAVSVEQRQLLADVASFHRRRGRWPSFRALQKAVVASSSPLSRALQMLEALGLIVWRKTIKVVRRPDGLFFGPRNEQAFTAGKSRGCGPQTCGGEVRT